MKNVSLNGISDKNLSWFITEAESDETRYCVLCGSKCIAERNLDRLTSWAMSMAKKTKLHDRHECPHRKHRLHVLAVRHRELASSFPEGALRSLAVKDFEGTLRELQLEITILEK
jgi:hypothetical protein